MTGNRPPGPGDVTVPADQVRIVLNALYVAAADQIGRAAMCTDCLDMSCTTCQWRLQASDDYEHLAAQMIEATEASAAPQRAAGHTASADSEPRYAPEPEAGQ
jgi:hypothetical protein